jgi:hypothetical protein
MSRESFAELTAIFSIRKKGDLKKHCRSITIEQADLANLILACGAGLLPFLHCAHHREFLPEHLHLAESDLGALVANGAGQMQPKAKKTANKISAIFDERRLLSGHLFYTPDVTNWHLFYFDQRDFDERNNHWQGGSHIHLINHLWPNRSAQEAWDEFCTGNPQMRGALHVKFRRRSHSGVVAPNQQA